MLKSRQGETHRDHDAQAEGGVDPLVPFTEGGRPPQERPFGEGRGGDSIRSFGEGGRAYGDGRLPPPPEGMRPYEDNRGPEGGMRLYSDGRPLSEDMRPYSGDGRHPEYGVWSAEGMGPYGDDGRPLEGAGPYDEREPYRESGPYDDEEGRAYRDEGMQHYEDWGPDERGRHYGNEQGADSMRPFDRDHPEGDMDMPPHLGPGEKQIFDYQHQSHPDPFRGRHDVFDYNHRPPPNAWDLPPPPPHMGPPPPFCDPHWLPPPHPLPPDCPPIPPPDMPPPIPYFDLPAGVMVMLVPVSSLPNLNESHNCVLFSTLFFNYLCAAKHLLLSHYHHGTTSPWYRYHHGITVTMVSLSPWRHYHHGTNIAPRAQL